MFVIFYNKTKMHKCTMATKNLFFKHTCATMYGSINQGFSEIAINFILFKFVTTVIYSSRTAYHNKITITSTPKRYHLLAIRLTNFATSYSNHCLWGHEESKQFHYFLFSFWGSSICILDWPWSSCFSLQSIEIKGMKQTFSFIFFILLSFLSFILFFYSFFYSFIFFLERSNCIALAVLELTM